MADVTPFTASFTFSTPPLVIFVITAGTVEILGVSYDEFQF